MSSNKKREQQIAALQSEDTKIRQAAALRLGRDGDASAIEPLLAALEDNSWKVRRNAAVALGNIGIDTAGEPLILVLSDRTLSVKRAAVTSLGTLRYSPATEKLVSLMEDKRLSDDVLATLIKIGAPALLHCCLQRSREGAAPCWQDTARRMILRGGDPLICRALAAREWNGQQLWLILDTVRNVQNSLPLFELWRLTKMGRINDIASWCERLTHIPSRAGLHSGCRQVLDYLMLGRASQRNEATESDELLRAAGGTQNRDTGETLLRASDQSEEAPRKLSALSRLRRLFGQEG